VIEPAVSGFQVALVIHVSAAIAGLGAAFAEGLIYPVALRLDPRHLPLKHRLQIAINSVLVAPALAILLLTGLYQADRAGYELGEFWLAGSMAIVVVLAIMVLAYFIPEDRRLGALAERDIAFAGNGPVSVSAEYTRRVNREAAAGALADLLVIAAVYLMVAKPGL
jgi:uncharacterized membrane protein